VVLGINQESTKNDVAASELSYPLWSIIDAVFLSGKEKGGKKRKSRIQNEKSVFQ
jgi:hypothetical protein